MTNREILDARPELLSEQDRQRQYVLRVELTVMPCPACGRGLNYFEAAHINLDDYDLGATRHECACLCGAELEQVIPVLSGSPQPWHWRLRQSWLQTQLEKARAYDLLRKEDQQS